MAAGCKAATMTAALEKQPVTDSPLRFPISPRHSPPADRHSPVNHRFWPNP
jgi:hypothetical protein